MEMSLRHCGSARESFILMNAYARRCWYRWIPIRDTHNNKAEGMVSARPLLREIHAGIQQ
jgi:hypothetical protein